MTIQLTESPIPRTGLDPLEPGFQLDPYPYYHWLLRNDPVHLGAEDTWYVTRYADVRLVMSDHKFGCASVRDWWEEMIGPGALKQIMRDTMFFEDDPKHARLRGLITPVFAPKRMKALQPKIDEVVDELLAPLFRRGEMEMVNEFAAPLALTFVCELLGIPREGYEGVRTWSLDIGPTLDLIPNDEEIRKGNIAMGAFADYLQGLIESRGSHRGPDLISVMLDAREESLAKGEPPVTMNEMVSTIISVVFAGHDTVTNQITNTMLALIRNPDQLDLLKRDPSLVSGCVEEGLRYDSAVQSNSRRLMVDVELGGKLLRKGDFVVALMGAANRDPAKFDDPDRFDITRTGTQVMSFGAGMRFCLGAILARLELRTALDRLVRMENVRLEIADSDISYQRSSMFRSLVELPVSFTPTGG
ncbi:cytochrome P450 [Micromonospora echinofusca]|uniref:Cytochrome P450 n=1 Tax=Micromonospora echinofusca TaxID=47858 RepID=A0ABS3VKK3_MICEH|nr:cytochrome P450 [Micromonospora echinofusca]MBO4205011.1 cytochrome P450 [Micromonospora echinofusca]